MQLRQIARDALLKPLQAVSGIVERRHTLPILANVLLEQKDGGLHVTATDLEMQITAHSTLPGKDGQAITVGARKLQDLLRALPDDATLNVDAGSGKMTVRAGRSRFNLQTLPATDYPRITAGTDQLQSLSLPQKDLRALFKLVEFAMAQQDIRYYLNGMLLVVDRGSLQAVATDGHRLSWASLAVDGEFARQEVILPRKTVLELGKLRQDVVALDADLFIGKSGISEFQQLGLNVRLFFKFFRETRVKQTFPTAGMLEDKDLANPEAIP